MSNVGIFGTTGWLAQSVWVVAAAAVLMGVVSVMMLMGSGRRRAAGGLVLVAAVALGIFAVREQTAGSERVAERRAFSQRVAALSGQTLAPGSPLACLNGLAGDIVESACENTLFGSAENVAKSLTYLAARFDLIRDGRGRFADDADMAGTMRMLRRPIEADRFGFVARLLQVRDDCDTFRCDALAFLADPSHVKSNLRSQVFDSNVARHASSWGVAMPKDTPVAENSSPTAFSTASVAPPPAAEIPSPRQVAVPLSSKYDFPSAASIPPVSIMTPEPGLPAKTESAKTESGKTDSAKIEPGKTESGAVAGQAVTPLPPRRPPAVRAATRTPAPPTAQRIPADASNEEAVDDASPGPSSAGQPQ